GVADSGTISSPVLSTATDGRPYTRTLAAPTAAATAIWAGPSNVPIGNTTAPAFLTDPRGASASPVLTLRSTVTLSAESRRVSSTGTTASAPEGTGAPVITAMACCSPMPFAGM